MEIEKILNELNIKYEEITHEPLYTVQDAKIIKGKIKGLGCKNLFLKDKKHYYLLILREDKRANLKELANFLNTKHLTFATIFELKSILNLEKGSVTPFGILYDTKNLVTILLDSSLKEKTLLFHPIVNTKTISINYNDLIRWIEYFQHNYFVI